MKTQIGKLVTGDFEDNTLTFEIENKEEMVIQSGRYAIVPIEDYGKVKVKVWQIALFIILIIALIISQ